MAPGWDDIDNGDIAPIEAAMIDAGRSDHRQLRRSRTLALDAGQPPAPGLDPVRVMAALVRCSRRR